MESDKPLKPSQQASSASSDSNHTDDNEKVAEIVVSRVTDAIVSFTDEYRTQNKESYSQQRKNDRWIKAGTIFLAVYTIITFFQWRTMRQSFRSTQRAAVYLGLPDGEIGGFLFRGKEYWPVLYFRNYGPTTAQRVWVEVWPVAIEPHRGSEVTIVIPPPGGVYFGPSIPPGFTYDVPWPSQNVTEEELRSGQKHLKLVGRVRYADSFGEYCETFVVDYNRFRSKFLTEIPLRDLCDTREDTIQAKTVVTEDGRVEFHYPPVGLF